MQNIFDYDAQANRSVLGAARADRALGIPTTPQLPGSFAPGASNATADALLQQATADTQAMQEPRPAPQRQPRVGYNPQTNEVFSGGRTFQLDLDQGVANAQLLDTDNPQLPDGFVPVYGDEVKARLKREYEGLGLVDAMQRRGGQMVSNVGSTMQDIGLPGAQTLQDFGGGLARRNPSHIATAQDMLDNPGQTLTEAVGEVAVDVPVALAQTAVGAKIGAEVGALAAPFTGGLSIPLGAILGGGAARFLGSLTETYGSVRADQRSAGKDDRGRALTAAGGSAALEALLGPEAILGGRMASRIGGKAVDMTLSQAVRQGSYGHIGRQLAAGALVEGPLTEAPQSAIERWGAGKDLSGSEAVDEYAIGAVKGAIGGAAASPLASMPEYAQARNFIANLNEDMRIAADLDVPTPERLAAARRVQDVYRGSSSDPRFDAQLQAFREKLRVLDEQHLAVTQAQDAGEAVATGAPANLMHLATPLDRDRSDEQDARLAEKAAAPEAPPELSSILAAGTAGAQWQQMQAQREQALQAAEQLAPQVQNVLDARGREVRQRGDLIEQVGAAAQPIVQGLEAQALPPAIEQAGQQFDQVMSGNLQAALEDPQTYGPYLDWQNAAMGGEEGVASPIAPTSPVGPTEPVRQAPAAPIAATLRPVASAPSTPAVVSSADAALPPSAPAAPGGLSSLEARTASNVGTVTGAINVPRAVQDAVSRALRGGKSPVVYAKGDIDTAATETWSERMRAMVDAAKGVVEAFHALDSREANLAPKSGAKNADATPTAATNAKATEAASTAYADVQRLRGQLRNAIDTLRTAAGGDKNVEGIVANLKGKTQEIKSKTADRAKSDTALDTRLSRAWAMYKDGALDVFESADVVRGRPVRESFEQKQKGATEPPLVTAERDGSPRHPMVQGAKETDAAFRKRKENATERGVNGTLAYLQLHGTGYERLLAAAVSRALRRFDGTPDAPKIKWVTAEETAAYDPKSNTVMLHTEASPEELLHETLHAALQWYVYQNPEIEEVRLLDKALQKVLDAPASAFTGKGAEVVAVLRKVDKGRSKTARLDAILELISYGSTLREFRQALKGVGTVKDGGYLVSGLTNLWNKLTQLVQKFLGVSNSLANDVLDGTVALLEQAADANIDAPGKRKGSVLKAEVSTTPTSPFDDPTDMSEEQAIARPGAALPTAVDVKRYNKRVLPEVASTKMLFDLVGWGKVADGVDKGGAWVGENVRKHFPGLSRWIRYIAPRFNVPQDVAAAFDQYKDDKQAGYKLTERLATFIQHRPPEQQLRIFEYLDGDKAALKDDPATAEIADQVLRWRDFYVDRIPDEKVKRRFASGKFSETMLFANDSESVASQTFGARKLSAMLGEKKQVEENLEEGWMMLDDRGDPVLDGVFYEVYRTNPDGSRMHDGFMARDQFDRTGAPAGHFVDTEYVWFHTGHKDGRHTFRASMTVPQAVQARKGEALANALRNTMAALSVNFASLEFARGLASHGHGTGNPELAVVFDSAKDAEAALGIKIDPRTVLDAGSEDARSAMARHEWSSRGRWVQLPKSKAYGDLSGKLIDAGVWAAMLDMSDRRPLTNVRALNTSMRWFKKAKTIYNPGTHVTNVATNFTLAMVHDIPMGTVKDAARLMLQYELRPNSMTKADRALVLSFMNSNAMVGDFSAAEVKQALYEAMKTSLDDGQPTIAGRLAAFAKLEKAKAQAAEKLSKAGEYAGRADELMTATYAAEDNVFRLAAFLKRAADLAAQRGDGRPTQEDLQKAGDFARWAFLDYDIDSRAVRLARQSVLPFISWTYAVIPVLAKVAVHQPWKIANVLLAYAILEHVMQEVMGGDEEDERLRKAGPEYVRDRMFGFGFGPYVHIRLPFGDDKNPVYYRLGDYMPWTNVARGQPNGFMGQDWFPSAITPTGPFVSTVLTAMAGVDPYFGKPLNPPTDSMWQVFLTRSREMLGQAAPPVLLDLARGERLADMVKGRVDKPGGFETLQMARWLGLKAYSFNEDQGKAAQSKAAGAITAEYRKELGRVRRAEARYEDPDWEGLAEKQRELLARLQDELDELRGE